MPEINIDWPLWPRQRQALESPANDQLFGGASEGGKSYFGRIAISLAGIQCEGLQMTLIRKKYEDILSNHLDGDRGFRALLYPLTSQGVVEVTEKRIRFPKNNICNFKHCQDERQFDSAQGNENQLVFVDEAPQIKERLIRAFRGWCRITPEHLARQPKFWQKKLPWMLQSGNPTGESVGYFKREYVKARPAFEIGDVAGFRRQFVPSRAEDNKSVDLKAHKDRLSAIGDAELARALDEGDWDAITGEFFPQWDEDRHVVADFTPPKHWFHYRSGDIGWAEPAAWYYIAVSDGEAFKDEYGNERWFPRGARIFYREYYLCNLEQPARGVELSNEEMADGILARSEYFARNVPTLTDSKPFQGTGGQTPALTFQKRGVVLTQVNTGPGSRVSGWSIMRSALIGQNFDGFKDKLPMVYFCECCKFARDYIPALPRHPSDGKKDDAAEHGEATHACDAIRYGLIGHKVIHDKVPEITNQLIEKITSRFG